MVSVVVGALFERNGTSTFSGRVPTPTPYRFAPGWKVIFIPLLNTKNIFNKGLTAEGESVIDKKYVMCYTMRVLSPIKLMGKYDLGANLNNFRCVYC